MTTIAGIAPDAPTAFDACNLPQSVIQSEGLDPTPTPANSAGNGGIKWQGCIWIVSNGYGASIRTTNLTIPMIQANKDFTIAEQVTIDGRQAITYHKTGQTDLQADCILNLAMKGGGVRGFD